MLHGFLKQRKTFLTWQEKVLHKLDLLGESTIIDLARSFSAHIDYRVILPLVYHLIASGNLIYDISLPLDEKQFVRRGKIHHQMNDFFLEGGVVIEA